MVTPMTKQHGKSCTRWHLLIRVFWSTLSKRPLKRKTLTSTTVWTSTCCFKKPSTLVGILKGNSSSLSNFLENCFYSCCTYARFLCILHPFLLTVWCLHYLHILFYISIHHDSCTYFVHHISLCYRSYCSTRFCSCSVFRSL
ncbi:hypothetical protein BDZ97DRAFT_1107241 [Flammula alnicola]|nr:hypothetical protein BDZ97DRAFT_1107241 [Flammula alnicola]